MNPPPNREVALFSAALELPANQRASYLQKACADDPALHQRIEALLRLHDEAIQFLESPAPGPREAPFGVEALSPSLRASSSPAETAGDRIGRYKLLQQIGEGGCGVVYMAEQEEPVRRRVALKVIKLGMDTKQVIARFEAERQALALMDHPNIAKVLDAGATETGRPYFVMELVRGIKITDYCDENNLSTRERLNLFIQVCRAIQHAHQKGIIHRDIKPSNILIASNDGVPIPKVIDFGIAKATQGRLTDQTVFTAFEQFIGTPAYMSPEQASLTMLDIDTRTDIYSLGVLLYELLTGKTPFDAKSLLAVGLDEMRRTIREQEPPRPSTRLSTMAEGERTTTAKHRHSETPKLISLLRGDLDWIAMKALEKERARRYETANGLAADVERYLAHEPVIARPPSGAYRFRKLVRRNRGVFAAGGTLILMLVLGIVASVLEAVRAGRAERARAHAALQADAQRQKAEAEAQLLKKMLQSVGPSVALGRDTKLVQDILDQTASSLSRALSNQPEVEVDLCLTLADTYYDLASYKQMEDLARHSLQVARGRLGNENINLANSLIRLGISLQKIAQGHLGEMHADFVSEDEKNLRLHETNLVEAAECCSNGLAVLRKVVGNDHLDVVRALKLQANIFLTQYKIAESITMSREALAVYKRLGVNDDRGVATLLLELAVMFAFREDTLAEAETMGREALAMQRRLLVGDHPDIAKSLGRLADVLRRQGKWAEAETNYLDCTAMWARLQASNRQDLAYAMGYLAEVLMHQGRLQEAEARRREALEVLRRLYRDDNANVIEASCWLADLLQREGKLDEAEARAREALASSQKLAVAGGGSLMGMVDPVDVLLSVLLAQHRGVEAEQLLGDMLKQTPEGKRGQELRVALLQLRGCFFARSRRWKEAIADLSQAVELEASDADSTFLLSVLLLETGDKERYRAHCEKMARDFRDTNLPSPLGKTAEVCLLVPEPGPDSEAACQFADQALRLGQNSYRVHWLHLVKGLAEYRAENFESAIDQAGRSIGQPTMVGGARPDAAAYSVLAMAQHRLKHTDEARATLAKAADIVSTHLLNRENANLDEYWVDWLIAHILLREAQALIEGQRDMPSKQSRENGAEF